MSPLEPRFQLPAPATSEEARQIQERLAAQAVVAPLPAVHTICGVDACYDGGQAWAAAALTDNQGNELDKAVAGPVPVPYPYIPGFLSFREAPVVALALEKLKSRPDCLLVDGMGIWHPRFCGLAVVLGVMFNLPSVGSAKTPFRGDWTLPGPERGQRANVVLAGRLVGAGLTTRSGVKPVWVSPGHCCDLDSAIDLVLRLARTRIPEPLRLAHRAARLAARP